MKTLPFQSLEILEDRIAPAGVVTVAPGPGAGEFIITGDDMNNFVNVFQTGTNTYRVEGTATDIFDGVATTSTFLDIGALTKLTFVGGDGNDDLVLTNLRTLTGLSFSGGIGNDNLDAVNLTVKGTMELHGNTGADTAEFDGLSTNISGDVTINSDTGAADEMTATFNAQKTVFGGNIFFTGGGGGGNLEMLGVGPVSIAKGVNFIAGTGGGTLDLSNSDLLTVGKLATGESILFTGSDNSDTLNFSGVNVTLSSGIRMTGGALDDQIAFNTNSGTVKIGKLATGQSILFDGGANDDSINTSAVSLTMAGAIDFLGGEGANGISLNAPNGITKLGKLATGQSIRFTGGAGDDAITTNSAYLTLAGGIDFVGGAGSNEISLDAANGFNKLGKLATGQSILFTGGASDDTITTNSASLTMAGGIDFVGGAGGNEIVLDGANGTGKIGKFATGQSIRFTGGANSDSITTTSANLALAGGIDFAADAGTNRIDLQGANGKTSLGKLAAGQSILFTGLGGNDTIATDVSSLTLAGGIDFTAGDGTNTIDFVADNGVVKLGKLVAGQSILFNGGAGNDRINSDLARGTLAGGIELNGAGGNDRLEFDDLGVVTIGKFGTGQSVLFIGTGNADDEVDFGGFVTLAGSVEVTGGSGTDDIDFDGKVSVGTNAAGVSVLLTGNDGNDRIQFADNVTLAGSLKLDGGIGNDTLELDDLDTLTVRGAVELLGGAGTDHFNLNAFSVVFGSTLTVTGGDDADTFSITADGSIAGNVNVDLGPTAAGTQTMLLASRTGLPSGLALKGTLVVDSTSATTADTFTLTNVSVAKLIDIKLGEGASTVTIDNLNAGDEFKLDTRGGADVVNIERENFYGGSVITKLATIQLGLGDDLLSIGNPLPAPNPTGTPDSTRVNFLGGLNADGGLGGMDNRNDIVLENDGVLLAGLTEFENTTLV